MRTDFAAGVTQPPLRPGFKLTSDRSAACLDCLDYLQNVPPEPDLQADNKTYPVPNPNKLSRKANRSVMRDSNLQKVKCCPMFQNMTSCNVLINAGCNLRAFVVRKIIFCPLWHILQLDKLRRLGGGRDWGQKARPKTA